MIDTKLRRFETTAREIAQELAEDKGVLAIILRGSVARGKESPGDVDISVIVKDGHRLSRLRGLVSLINGLSHRYKARIDMNVYTVFQVNALVRAYRDEPETTLRQFAHEAVMAPRQMDLTSAPLHFILPDQPDLEIIPLRVFREPFKVLHGQGYLNQMNDYIRN